MKNIDENVLEQLRGLIRKTINEQAADADADTDTDADADADADGKQPSRRFTYNREKKSDTATDDDGETSVPDEEIVVTAPKPKPKPAPRKRYDAIARGAMDFKRSDYVKSKEEGDKFREWIYTNKPKYPETVLAPRDGVLDKTGPIDNEIFSAAWADHGEEYICSTKKAKCDPGSRGFKAPAAVILPFHGIGRVETSWGFKEARKKGGNWSHKSRMKKSFLRPQEMETALAALRRVKKGEYHEPLSNVTTIELIKPTKSGITPGWIDEINIGPGGRIKLIINSGEYTNDMATKKNSKKSNTAAMMTGAVKDYLKSLDQEELNKLFNIRPE